MASRGTKMSSLMAIAIALSMLSGVAVAQLGCTSALMNLAPCLDYISGSGTTPSSSCCSQLGDIVKTQAQCLCQVVNGGASSFGITINQTKALALPGACKVQTPPASRCNAVNQPSSGSAASPAGSPSSPPADTTTPADATAPDATETPGAQTPPTRSVSTIPSAGTGSKSTTGNTNSGNSITFPMFLTLFLLISSSASAFSYH